MIISAGVRVSSAMRFIKRRTRLGGVQGYGSIEGVLRDVLFDRTLNRRVPLEHFVLLGAGMDAHTLVQGSERAELGSIVRLVGRRLDD